MSSLLSLTFLWTCNIFKLAFVCAWWVPLFILYCLLVFASIYSNFVAGVRSMLYCYCLITLFIHVSLWGQPLFVCTFLSMSFAPCLLYILYVCIPICLSFASLGMTNKIGNNHFILKIAKIVIWQLTIRWEITTLSEKLPKLPYDSFVTSQGLCQGLPPFGPRYRGCWPLDPMV